MSTPLRYSVPVESDFRLYRSRGRLWWLALGVLCTLFLAADLIGVESGGLKHLDRSLDLSLHSTFGRSADSFLVDVSNLASGIVRTVVVVLVAAILLVRRRWISTLLLVIAVGGAALLDTVLKMLVGRPRPHFFHHAVSATGYSFPSSHATGAAALAFVLAYLVWHLTRRRGLALICLSIAMLFSLLVGLSRLVLGVHYPTDVAGGFALAGAWIGYALAVFARPLAQEHVWRTIR